MQALILSLSLFSSKRNYAPTPPPHYRGASLFFPIGDYGTANVAGASATCMCGVSSGSTDSKWQQTSTWKGTGVSLSINLFMRLNFFELTERVSDRERERINACMRNYGFKGVRFVFQAFLKSQGDACIEV